MVKMVTQRLAPQARQAGQVSSRTSGALGRLSGAVQGTANTFSQYYEEKARIEGDLFLATVQEEWARQYADRAKNAGPGFASSVLSDFDKYVDDQRKAYQERLAAQNMANVPDRNRAEIDASLQKYRMRIETQARQREAAARAAAVARAASEATRLRANALISDPSLLGEYMETARTPDERALYVRTALSAEVRNNPEAVNEQVLNGAYDAYLTPAQKLSFVKLSESGIAAQDRERQAELEIERRGLEADLEEELAFASANGAPPVDSSFDPEMIKELYADDPERGRQVVAAYQDGVQFAETVADVALAPPEQLQAEFEKLRQAVAKPGNTQQDVKRLGDYVQAVQARDTALREDAAGYVIRSEETVSTLYDMVTAEDQIAADGGGDTQVAAIKENYVATLDLMYDTLGVDKANRPVLPKPDAQALAQKIQSMGSDVAPYALAQIVDSWGDASPRVIAQLSSAGLAPEYVSAMRHTDNPALAQAIVEVAAIPVADLRKGAAPGDARILAEEINAAMTDYRTVFETGGDSSAIETINNEMAVAEKVALNFMRKGVSPTDAAANAVEQMFPEQVAQGWNEAFIVPVGFDINTILAGADAAREGITEADITAIDDPRFPDFADMAVTLEAARRSGVWVNNSTGDGVQLMVPIDGALVPLRRADGEYFGGTFQDLLKTGADGVAAAIAGGQGVAVDYRDYLQ